MRQLCQDVEAGALHKRFGVGCSKVLYLATPTTGQSALSLKIDKIPRNSHF